MPFIPWKIVEEYSFPIRICNDKTNRFREVRLRGVSLTPIPGLRLGGGGGG